MDKKAMVYIQSGGPTAVINSSLYGAIKEAKKHPDQISHIYGSINGIEGLLNDELIDLNQEGDETIELLKQTPGSVLGTSRYKLPKEIHKDEYKKIIATLNKHNIGYVFVNGGNDSMDTCHKLTMLCNELNLDIKIIGVPKTVDNDLAETDHSNGFGSAAKYICNTVKEICIDASCYKKGKAYIIEIMGRNAGWLTASVDLLTGQDRPDLIYLPENNFDVEKFMADAKAIFDQKGYVIAALSEGVKFERDISKVRIDSFGHKQLGGVSIDLAKMIEHKYDIPTRAIELSLPQRAYAFLVSKVDQDEAIECGKFAVLKALEGLSGYMIAIKRVSTNPYKAKLEPVEISKIANVERVIPSSMMKDNHHMDKSFHEYCYPLIQGEIDIKYENGIIKSAELKKIKVE